MAFPLADPGSSLRESSASVAGPSAAPDLADLNVRFGPVTMAGEQRLTVRDGLTSLVPGGGLTRGTSLAINGSPGCGDGATTLALALAAGAAATGSWVAVVGWADLGLAAMQDVGLALDRVVLIDAPPPQQWATVVAALFDAFDVILLAPTHSVGARDSRRLQARSRERGSVMIRLAAGSSTRSRHPLGSRSGQSRSGQWEDGADLTLDIVDLEWSGLGEGHGALDSRRVSVSVSGRRLGAPVTHRVWLPNVDGEIVVIPPEEDMAVEGIAKEDSDGGQDSGLASVVPIRALAASGE